MKIGIDMHGGDLAPLEAVKGVKKFLLESPNVDNIHLTLLGDETLIKKLLAQEDTPSKGYDILHAPDLVEMDEHPVKALKEKAKSAFTIGFGLMKGNKLDGFISAGNTGAMLVATMYSIRTIEKVQRPCIPFMVPQMNENNRYNMVLDAGMNADCKPENIVQFATLGAIYSKFLLDKDHPRVGLLNVGAEEGKGNLLMQASYGLLKNEKNINFIGNVEGRDILFDKADVMLCDGYTGNILLKLLESIYDVSQTRAIKDEYFNDYFNFEHYGGVPILGVEKPIIIGHGISSQLAFSKMIELCYELEVRSFSNQLVEALKERE